MGANAGGILAGVGSLAGAAGDIYSLIKKPQSTQQTQAGYGGLIQTPGYSFGGGTLTRRNNDFMTGQRRLRDVIGGLRGQVQPGFGRLTESGVQAIRNKAASAAGNLRANLAQRGLAGASFGQDAQTRMGLEYDQLENQFRAQAFQEELSATNQLLDQEQNSLLSQLQQEFGELGVATAFLNNVKQAAITQKDIAAALNEEKLLAKLAEKEASPAAQAIGAGQTGEGGVYGDGLGGTPKPKPKPKPKPGGTPKPWAGGGLRPTPVRGRLTGGFTGNTK